MTEKLISDEELTRLIETIGASDQLGTPFMYPVSEMYLLIRRLRSAESVLKIYAGMDTVHYVERLACNHNYDDDTVEKMGHEARAHFERVKG